MSEPKSVAKEGNILIIEDNLDIQLSAKLLLKKKYKEVVAYEDPSKALQALKNNSFNVILLDMNFSRGETSGREGIHWLKKIMEYNPSSKVVMITAYGEIDLAIKAIKIGAVDFVLKPWQNEKLLAVISSAYNLNNNKNGSESIIHFKEDKNKNPFIGQSEAMKKVMANLEKVASTDANVLILGENGTGKDLVAKAIHLKSQRADKSFVKIDVGAITETLFESELFGHKKGSFTDAREDRTGWFEAANNGTLFLDEIGNLSVAMQSKLLTSIQNKQIVKVGSNQAVPVNIRLICATNMPLHQMANENTFRKDLLYRINTVEINIPPLRERREDIPLLIDHYLHLYSLRYGKENISLSLAARKILIEYNWPGNVRELQNALERAVILAEGIVLYPQDFQMENNNKSGSILKDSLNLEEMEQAAIKEALLKFQGNISHAARELGLTRAALYRRLEKYGI